MKKLLLSILCVCACAFTMSAESVNIVSGDKNITKIATNVYIDFGEDNLMIDNQTLEQYTADKGEKWREDFANDLASALGKFVKRWNKEMKKGMQLVNTQGGEYTAKLVLTGMHWGNAYSAAFNPFSKDGTKLTGHFYIYQNGNVVLDVDFFEVQGKPAISDNARFKIAFERLAKAITKKLK